MTGGFEKKLIAPAGYASIFFGVIAFFSFCAFAFQLAKRGFYAVVGWTYSLTSIADTLGLNGSRGLLGWDRAFLYFGLAIGAFYIAMWIEAFIEWAKRSPEERVQHHERAASVREELRAADIARQQALAGENAKRRADRRPMSGWRRLWIVLSVILGGFAAMLSWQPTHIEYVSIPNSQFTEWDNFWKLPKVEKATANCGSGPIRGERSYSYEGTTSFRLECPAKEPIVSSFLWAIFPGLMMAAVGLIVRWVYRGFRPNLTE